MGYSVSGSFAIIAIGLLIAAGTFYTASSEHLELVTDGKSEAMDRQLERINTAIKILETTWNSGEGSGKGNLTVKVNNTGTSVLAIEDTDVIVNNNYTAHSSLGTKVNGDAGTNLWRPGQQLRIEMSLSWTPNRVKIVVETGVSDAEAI